MPQAAPEDSLAIVVNEQWLDQFCEQVGSLCAVLQSLSKIPGHDRPHTLAREALDNCASLQDLLNAIPVWGGQVSAAVPAVQWNPSTAERPVSGWNPSAGETPIDDLLSELGDNFPEIDHHPDDQLPSVDHEALHDLYQQPLEETRQLLQRFCERSEGDLRQLELLSVGHDWTRLSRLAGVLKDSAAHVSAARIVVDAAALQGAARVGCRNDVELALGALRADLRDCVHQVETWCATETVA